jgi:hypothetical protein
MDRTMSGPDDDDEQERSAPVALPRGARRAGAAADSGAEEESLPEAAMR